MPEAVTVFASLIRLLADPKTSAAIIAMARDAIEFGIAARDRLTREGSWEHQDAIDKMNLHFRERFTALHQKHMADGVLSDQERLELGAAYDAMMAALKLLPA